MKISSKGGLRPITCKRQSGFTLLEVILSIALLTTIMLLSINLLTSEIALRKRIIDRYPFDKVMNRIATDIAGSFVQKSLSDNKQINFVHSKTSNNSSLMFTVLNYESLIADSKESSIARIGYIVEKNQDQNQLIRIVDNKMEEGKYIPFPGVGLRTVLVEDIKDFNLLFWKNKEFVDSWDSTTNELNKLPKMVKIILTLYLPNAQNSKEKQELHLEMITYVRNSTFKPPNGAETNPNNEEQETEEYTWQ